MPKRLGGDSLTPPNPKNKTSSSKKHHQKKKQVQDDVEEVEEGSDLEYEDPYVDEYEQEEIIDAGDEDEDLEVISESELQGIEDVEDDDEDLTGDSNTRGAKSEKQVWRPGIDQIEPYEVLDYDSSAYDMMFPLNVEWPCLSFDIFPDPYGGDRKTFPHTMAFIAGTQADKGQQNKLLLLKLSDLSKTRNDDSEDEDEDEDEDDNGNEDDEEEDDDDDNDPVVESRWIKHKGSVNRLRIMPQHKHIVATWSDSKHVHIWDLKEQVDYFFTGTLPTQFNTEPVFTYQGHKAEGFAMDWAPLSQARLLTGDCKNKIHLWNPAACSAPSWAIDDTPFTGHTGSVEDIQWSPSEVNVFASGSVDKTIKIWDIRMKQKSALSVAAHTSDVNVLSWNRIVQYLIVSGSDDNSIKVWDLRKFASGQPSAHFSWHQDPITSVEWHPTDESVLAACSESHLTIWDLSVEEDQESEQQKEEYAVPPQLMFIHQGQTEIKELHWHKQIPGVILSTAESGFNVFKTCNI